MSTGSLLKIIKALEVVVLIVVLWPIWRRESIGRQLLELLNEVSEPSVRTI